jgi:hypothetical protein
MLTITTSTGDRIMYRFEHASNGNTRVLLQLKPGLATDGFGHSEWTGGYVRQAGLEYLALDRESHLLRQGFSSMDEAAAWLEAQFAYPEWLE